MVDEKLQRMNLDEAVELLAHRASVMNAGLGVGGPTVALPILIDPVVRVAQRVLELAQDQATFTGVGGPGRLKPLSDLVASLYEGITPEELRRIEEEDEGGKEG